MDGSAVQARPDEALFGKLQESITHLVSLLQDISPASASEATPEAGVLPGFCATPGANDLKRLIQLRARRRRDPTGSFLEWPAWDMLLDLAVVKAEGGHVSVSAICVCSGAPQSTALRKLAQLERAGLVRRYLHEKDRRRVCLALTDRAMELVQTMLDEDLRFYGALAAVAARQAVPPVMPAQFGARSGAREASPAPSAT
ncbi:winged helix DNA-binding protein [Muricoccus aerilatus]|uniref:winged helix DNA-binding protein n=1 Tax=Muricoccus aerilatus TaxID=452982 RepID=UPI000693F319|nr:MarR family transcriptional regulator [Roseomonas aerilata]